jgi:hypothetical protein
MARTGPRTVPFANNSRTFDQLKNAGGFRLIRSSETSNKVMAYYTQLPWLRLLEENYNKEFDDFKRTASKIFDPGIFRKQEDDKGVIHMGHDNPALRSYEPGLLKELGLYTVYLNGTRRSKLPMLEKLKETAEELVAYLRNKYRIR